MIKILVLPKGAFSLEILVDLSRRETLDPLKNFGKAPFMKRFQEQMNMVRHDHIAMKRVSLGMSKPQDLFDKSSERVILKNPSEGLPDTESDKIAGTGQFPMR